MAGYFEDTGATAAALSGGWLHTGDFGHVDSDGYYYLAGGVESRPETAAS